MIEIQKTWLIPSAFEFVIRLFTGFIAVHSVAKKIMSPQSYAQTQSYAPFSLPSREVSGVERQLGVVRVVCG